MELWGTPNPIGRVNGTRLRMLRKILADGMQTVAELADALCMEQRAVRDNATQAVKAGLLEKRLDDVTKTLSYSITKAGREYVLSREHESAESARDNAAAESTASNTPAEQAPDEVETAPIQAADTQQECEAEQPCGEDCAETPPATASSDMPPDQHNVSNPALSTAGMLRVIKAITEGEYLAASGIPTKTFHEHPQASAPAAPPVGPDKPNVASARVETKTLYAFAREDGDRVDIEWLTDNLQEAIEEARTASSIDAVVFRLTPVCRAQRVVTFYD